MARVPELVATTLDRLATQAALYIRDQAPEPYIPIGQLRDDVLRFELHGSRREELWKRVRAVVEGNANVRAAVREGRGGDVARVWEWIGGIGGVGAGRLEDAGAGGPSSRRDSSAGKVHFSLTPSQEQRQIGSGGGDATPDGNILNALASSPRETRTWNEGRPIY